METATSRALTGPASPGRSICAPASLRRLFYHLKLAETSKEDVVTRPILRGCSTLNLF